MQFWHTENLECLANSTKSPRISGRYKVFWSILAILNSNSTFKIFLSVFRCSFVKYSLCHKWNILVIYTLLRNKWPVTNLWCLGAPFHFYNLPFFYTLIRVSLKSVTVILSGPEAASLNWDYTLTDIQKTQDIFCNFIKIDLCAKSVPMAFLIHTQIRETQKQKDGFGWKHS